MLRKAKLGDVDAIVALLTGYAKQGLLLPRSRQSVCETLLQFRVVEEQGEVLGVAALHILGDDLAEIRSLAIAEPAHGRGYGRQLVEALCEDAAQVDVPRVLALTYQESFFLRCGFHVVDKSSLQQKIWKDCIHCKKFPVCDEVAMIRLTPVGLLQLAQPAAV
ncbi:MAG: N-acetyltransferase [Firmicutes bacterium]|nr:N-acetyltransferase [Bacillota bacterium]